MYGYKHQITSRLRGTGKAVPIFKCTLAVRILAFSYYFGYCLPAPQLGVSVLKCGRNLRPANLRKKDLMPMSGKKAIVPVGKIEHRILLTHTRS